jgi:V8-like Glu-specific endopeptidase
VAVLFRESSELVCSGPTCDLLSVPYTAFFSPPLCEDEPFRAQNTLGFCSGFLVGPDLVATAGHCVTSQSDCNGIALHFNFVQPGADSSPLEVPADDVYYCTTLVARKQKTSTGEDWALIQLDRAVAGVTPLCIRRTGTPAIGNPELVIGHPFTLPKKVAGGAQVKSSNFYFFDVNADTYGGNSGSPVFDVATLTVDGILVRGNPDYVTGTDSQGACTRSNVCPDSGCPGWEDATHTKQIASLVPAVPCYVPPVCTVDPDCDDANPCNGAETCVAGQCVAGTPIDCSDGNACTTDSCDPATSACSSAPLDCTGGNTCLSAACDPVTGCSGEAFPDGTVCPTGTCYSATCFSSCAFLSGFVGTGPARTSIHNLGVKSNATVDGTLSCPGSGTDVDLYLDAKTGPTTWTNIASSIGNTCSEHIRFNVGTSAYNGLELRWRVYRYTGPNTNYSLRACEY